MPTRASAGGETAAAAEQRRSVNMAAATRSVELLRNHTALVRHRQPWFVSEDLRTQEPRPREVSAGLESARRAAGGVRVGGGGGDGAVAVV